MNLDVGDLCSYLQTAESHLKTSGRPTGHGVGEGEGHIGPNVGRDAGDRCHLLESGRGLARREVAIGKNVQIVLSTGRHTGGDGCGREHFHGYHVGLGSLERCRLEDEGTVVAIGIIGALERVFAVGTDAGLHRPEVGRYGCTRQIGPRAVAIGERAVGNEVLAYNLVLRVAGINVVTYIVCK